MIAFLYAVAALAFCYTAIGFFRFLALYAGGRETYREPLPQRVARRDQINGAALVSALKADRDPQLTAKILRLKTRMTDANKSKG